MKIIDKIALNRLIAILTNFILSIIKIFSPKNIDGVVPIKPDKRPFPWLRKQIDKVIKK